MFVALPMLYKSIGIMRKKQLGFVASLSRFLPAFHDMELLPRRYAKALVDACVSCLLPFIHRGAGSSDQRRGHVERGPGQRRRLRTSIVRMTPPRMTGSLGVA